ncbi:MAG: hypothetical protein PHI18_03430 [bacterium]|nr:hypothetical protein [bacterium]
MTFRQEFLLISALLLAVGCTQRESDVGIQAITGLPADGFSMVSGTATNSAHWNPQFTNGYGTSLHAGDAKGLFAYTAIRFNVPESVPDSFRVDTLQEIQIRLTRNRIWPEQTPGNLRIVLREITESWDEANLLPDSLPGREGYPALDSGAVFSATDTLYFLTIPLDLWARWAAGDSTTFGLVLEPRFEGYMVEWFSSEYQNVAYPNYPPALLVPGQVWLADSGEWVDSTLVIGATDDAFLTKDAAPRRPERMFAGQGNAERIALFFPVDSLSSDFRRVIARAELHLFADPDDPAALQFVTGQSFLLKDGFLNDSSWTSASDSAGFWDPSIFETGYESTTAGTWDSTGTEFILNITGLMSEWVGNPVTNSGMQVIPTSESSYLSRIVFHSHLSETIEKRPRLHIWYTESTY